MRAKISNPGLVVPKEEVSTWRMHMGGSKAIGKFKVKIATMHIYPRYRNVNGIKARVRNPWLTWLELTNNNT